MTDGKQARVEATGGKFASAMPGAGGMAIEFEV
jgi:hypothetical protein